MELISLSSTLRLKNAWIFRFLCLAEDLYYSSTEALYYNAIKDKKSSNQGIHEQLCTKYKQTRVDGI